MSNRVYYHGTTPEMAQSILENGFKLTHNDNSNFKGMRHYDNDCLYAFTNLDDAIDFICNQGHNKQAVLSFTITGDTDVISDPEYDVDGCENTAVILFGDYFDTDNESIVWSQE